MNSHEHVSDSELLVAAHDAFYDRVDRRPGELRLMLLELLTKSDAGFYNSHTENIFLKNCKVQKRDDSPNKKGRLFIVSMVYWHSNLKPECYYLMKEHRQDQNQ